MMLGKTVWFKDDGHPSGFNTGRFLQAEMNVNDNGDLEAMTAVVVGSGRIQFLPSWDVTDQPPVSYTAFLEAEKARLNKVYPPFQKG